MRKSRNARCDLRARSVHTRYWLATTAAALGLVTSGCGRNGTDRRAGTDSQLIVAVSQDGGVLTPYSGAPAFLLELVYDKLFGPSPYVADPEPALARHAVQLDSLTWLVTVRDGVRWHDGKPFSADDVRFTYEYFRDGPANRYGHHVSEVPDIDRITLVDSVTVRFECAYPCPLLARVTMADLPIIPRHMWEGNDQPRRQADLPIGTGPFRLVEYRSDQLYRFLANPDYFAGAPAVRELIMPIIGDYSSMFVALRTGEIDAAAQPVPAELRARLDNVPGVELMQTAPLTIVELRPNYRKPPFSSPKFRAALSSAIDRQSIVHTVLLGQGRPGLHGYPHPDSPWTNPTNDTPYDVDRAVDLFDSLGFTLANGVRTDRNGSQLRFTLYVSGGEPLLIRTAELVARQLTEIGIPTDVETLERAVLSQRVQASDYDLFVSEIGAHGVADPDQFIMSHRTGYLWHRDLPYPEMDSLYVKWRAAATVDDRRTVSFAMQRLFNQQPTSIALYYPDQHWAFRTTAYDAWRESPGYGIVHKWSFLPRVSNQRTGS